jgi:hypothetical protein
MRAWRLGFLKVLLSKLLDMLGAKRWRDESDVQAAAMLAMPGLDESLAGLELLLERDGAFDRLSIDEARIGAWMGRTCRADSDDRPGADLSHAFAMGIAVDRFVRAKDRVSAAQQGNACGHTEAQALKRGETRLSTPEFRCRSHRIGLVTGFVPGVTVAAAHGLDETVTRMGMAVDQTRHDDLVAGIDDRGPPDGPPALPPSFRLQRFGPSRWRRHRSR